MPSAILPLLAASALALPQLDPGGLMNTIAPAIREDGAAVLELVIDTRSRVVACEVLQTTSPRATAERVCRIAKGVRYSSAAQGPDGEKAYSRVVVNFSLGDKAQTLPQPPNMTIINPKASRNPLPGTEIRIDLFVGADGAVEACAGPLRSEPELAEIACRSAKSLIIDPIIGTNGQPVPFVTSLFVAFEPG